MRKEYNDLRHDIKKNNEIFEILDIDLKRALRDKFAFNLYWLGKTTLFVKLWFYLRLFQEQIEFTQS